MWWGGVKIPGFAVTNFGAPPLTRVTKIGAPPPKVKKTDKYLILPKFLYENNFGANFTLISHADRAIVGKN